MKRFYRVLLLIVLSLATVITVWPQPVSAANFNYDTHVTYRAVDNQSLQVTEKYKVTNNTSRYYLTELKLSTPTDSIRGLSVRYDDGGVIPATTIKRSATKGDIKYDYQEIHIIFPRTLYGQNRSWGFSVSYTAEGLVESKGNSHTVYIPSVEERDAGDVYKVTVDVPASFGTPHFPGAKTSSTATTSGRQFFNFNQADLIKDALALTFGDSTVYQMNFNFPLNNDSPLPKVFTVTLPPDLANQKSYVNRLDPAPSNLRLDADGNVLADYTVAGRSSLTVKTDIHGEVRYLDYDLTRSGKKTDIPSELVSRYTKGSRYWHVDGAVKDAASKLNDDNAPVINNVKAMYRYVIDHLSYNKDKIKFNIRQGASRALSNPENSVCLEYADLLISMLRSQGIPARMPVGYGYSGSLKNSNRVADSLHAWVEAYVPGIGWIELDPTWGEKFDQFGKSDLDHFAFAVWGDQDQAPDAVMAGRSDAGYQYENATLAYLTKATPVSGQADIKVRRWAVLPFLSLDQVSVTAGPGGVTDGNFANLNGGAVNFGSLAPAQTLLVNRLVFGKNWLSGGPAEFSRHQDGQVLVLASAQIKTSTVPLVLVVVLAGGGALWLVLRLRSVSHRQLMTASEESSKNEAS